jgi:hypothetical protein
MQRKSYNEERLENRLAQASDTISNLNSIISAIGVLLGLFIGIAGFGLYFFGIKPSQDAVNSLEENMDNRISLYLEKQTNYQLEKSIDSLNSKNEITRSLAFLSLQYKVGTADLNETQVLKIVKILKTGSNLDALNQINIHEFLLFLGPHDVLDEYFFSILDAGPSNEKETYSDQAARYFFMHGNSEDINRFVIFLNKSATKDVHYLGWLSVAASINRTNFFNLLWSQVLVDALYSANLSQEQKDFIIKNVFIVAGRHSMNESEIRETYFFKKIK